MKLVCNLYSIQLFFVIAIYLKTLYCKKKKKEKMEKEMNAFNQEKRAQGHHAVRTRFIVVLCRDYLMP